MSLTGTIGEFPLFTKPEEKKKFLIVLGLLASKTITLGKATELLEISRVEFSLLLRAIGFEYSYLDEVELQKEVAASKDFLKCSFG